MTNNKASTDRPSLRVTMTNVLRAARVTTSLEAHGIKIEVTSRVRYSNMTTVNGRIDDGIVHSLPSRWEVSGNTYSVRDLAKAAGFRWDPKFKVWHAPMKSEATELGAKILRRLAA